MSVGRLGVLQVGNGSGTGGGGGNPPAVRQVGTADLHIDLSETIGESCYRVYRFDDDYLYILHQGGVTKVDNSFQKIYTLKVSETFNRYESGYDRNLMGKIGNNIFIAVCNERTLVYMYDEVAKTGTYLDNPSSLAYYGSLYTIDGRIYYFHRYQNAMIYVYDADGVFLKSIENPYTYLKYSGGTAFTTDFHVFDTTVDSFQETALTFPIESDKLDWVFSNGNLLSGYSYGFSMSDLINTSAYNFKSIALYSSRAVSYARNKNNTGTLVCSLDGIYYFYYPYSVTNPVARQYTLATFNGALLYAAEYKDKLYCVTDSNMLVIKDIKYLGYDAD